MRRAKVMCSAGSSRARSLVRFEPIEPRTLLAAIAGNYFEDLDADGTKDSGERGLSGWTVYLDANNNSLLDLSAPVVVSNNSPKSIPDQGMVESTVSISNQSSPIARVIVTLSISHTYNADLDVYLISPQGTRVELFTDVGAERNGFNVTLDSSAAASITTAPGSPITGTWRPEGSLAALAGQSANGIWRLEVTDDQGNDVGTLNGFSLQIICGERSATTDAGGNYLLGNLAVGTHVVRQVVPAGWEGTYPAGGAHSVTLASSGTNLAGRNFGARMPPGQIGGFVFADYNSNGVREPNEPGQAGWTVYIDADNDGHLDAGEIQTLSAGDGAYSFVNLNPGQYTVRQVLPAGWAQTSPGSGGVVLLPVEGPPAATAGGPVLAERQVNPRSIVVAFEGKEGLGALRRQRRQAMIAGLFDLSRSRDLFSVDGVSLVNIALPSGVDPLKAADRFSRLSGVQWAQPEYVYTIDPREMTPNDPSYAQQYHHTLMKNNLAWDTTVGSNVIIAITDDGVSLSHPDLAPNIWVNTDEIAGNGIDDDSNGYVDDVNGWDFASNDNNPNPTGTDYHGTHVAGIAAARVNNATGVAGTAGGAKIMPLRFIDGINWSSTMVANSFHYAADNGARIVSTSYNIDLFVGDSIFSAALQYLYDHDVLYLNSAGNSAQINPPRQVFDQALFVANTTSADKKSTSSNYGYGIDLSAPGTSIFSTLPNNAYGTLSGTSMSTPNVAGVAALIWSAHPDWTRDQVAAQLIGSADNIDGGNPLYAGLLGSGRVNSFRGVTQTIAPPRIRSIGGLPAEGGVSTVSPSSFTLDVASVFDPATVASGSFELRGDGVDNTFGTADDTLVPLTLNTTYRIGTNRLAFSVPASLASDTYRFTALTALKDPFGQTLDGNGNGLGGDAFTRMFSIQPISDPYVMTVASFQTTTGDFGSADTIAPRVLTAAFGYQTGHSIQMSFSEDIGASLNAVDLVLRRLDGPEISIAQVESAYDVPSQVATFTFSGLPGPILPDGNYVATLSSPGVTDLFGRPLDGDGDGVAGTDFQFSFFVLAGDADHDRDVDVNDLYAMGSHFLQSGVPFSEGDFNYDGIVDAKDLGIMAVRWGQTLPPPTVANTVPVPATASRRPATRTPTRVIDLVL